MLYDDEDTYDGAKHLIFSNYSDQVSTLHPRRRWEEAEEEALAYS